MLTLLYQVHRCINTCTMSRTSNSYLTHQTYRTLTSLAHTKTCGSIKLYSLYQHETGCLRALHFTRKIYSNNKQQDWGHLQCTCTLEINGQLCVPVCHTVFDAARRLAPQDDCRLFITTRKLHCTSLLLAKPWP